MRESVQSIGKKKKRKKDVGTLLPSKKSKLNQSKATSAAGALLVRWRGGGVAIVSRLRL